MGTTGRKSEAGGQIVGWKSRGDCLRLRGRISVPGKGTWASEGGSLTRGKDFPVQRPLFLGDLDSKPYKDPHTFRGPGGRSKPRRGARSPHPALAGRSWLNSFGSAHRPCPKGLPRTEVSSPCYCSVRPRPSQFPLLLFAKGAALWNRDKGPGSVAGTIVPAWGPITRASSAARLRRGGGT